MQAARRGRGSSAGGRPGRGQGREALPTPAAPSNLKGYSLDGPEEPASTAPAVRESTGAAERPLTGGDSLASPGRPAPPPEEDGNDEGALLEAISLSLGKDRRLDAEDKVQPTAASSSEVRFSACSLDWQSYSPHKTVHTIGTCTQDEGGPGVVSFVDERHSHHAPIKRRRVEPLIQTTKQKRKGGPYVGC